MAAGLSEQQPDEQNGSGRSSPRGRSVRDSLTPDSGSDGMLAFLGRLARFGLVAEGGPVLRPRNFAG